MLSIDMEVKQKIIEDNFQPTFPRFSIHKNLIVLDGDSHLNVFEDDWPVHRYRATLGHKVNHAFDQSGRVNTVFSSAFHPRYGSVRSIQASKDIARGEQVTYSKRTLGKILKLILFFNQLLQRDKKSNRLIRCLFNS